MRFKDEYFSEVINSDSPSLGLRTIYGSKIKVGDVIYGVFIKNKYGRRYFHIKDINLKHFSFDNSENQLLVPTIKKKRIKNKSKKL